MPDDANEIAYCQACRKPMNIAAVAPFTNVACPSCGQHTRVKREFGPYTLVRRHAIGGMSFVFIAQDNTLGREVAVKILNESYSADARRIAAFEEEARITASFSHPHVVRVFTTGVAFDRFYIAMELVAGGHFEHQIRERGTIPERDLLPLAIQVAEGLKAAHAAGLIHRDIKPGNILLDSEGNAKIVDFGLALVTKGGRAQAQEIWATPYYVPPETLEGQPEDFRSDLYAFGATLYHALAGKPSCPEESMSTIVLRAAKQKVQPLHVAAPWLLPETCAIVERAMAYHPSARFESYDEMISQLRIALQRARSAPAVSAGAPPAKKRQTTLAPTNKKLLFGVLGAASLGLTIWLLSKGSPTGDPTAGPAPGNPPSTHNPAPAGDPEITSKIAVRYRTARAAMESRDYTKAAAEFAALRDNAAVQEPTRTWAGVEALAAALLDGDSTLARTHARAIEKHLRQASLANPQIRKRLLPVITAVQDFPAIEVTRQATATHGAPDVLALTLAGLKNWEQGLLDQAAPCFEAVLKLNIPAQDNWSAIYQQLAADYLADFKLLNAPAFADYPAALPDCDAAIAELNQLLTQIKTRGRARFNIRAWQLDIAKHSRLLETSQTPPPPSQSLNTFTDRHQFAAATRWLKSLNNDPPEGTRESLISLTESAATFLANLEADLKPAGASLPLTLKNGDPLTRAESAGQPGHITGILADNTKREIPWGDLTADSIIELHRLLVRDQSGEAEKLNRFEGAIAFDWLAGNRQRAAAAAERLGQQNPTFQQRWQTIAAGLAK